MPLTTVQAGMLDSTAQYYSFKNRIINGAMVIDQRNAGASITFNDGVFPVDRWTTVATQSSKGTIQQNAGAVTPPAGFINYLGFTSSSAYSVLTGDAFAIQHRIEGLNLSDFGWGSANAQTVTLSFWVRSSLTGTFGGSVSNSAQNRSYPFTFTISAANTWEQKTVTIAGDTSGTWLTTNGIGARVQFGLGAGSTFSATAGAWNSSTTFSATGATSVVGTNGATFYITGVQLEKGSTATSFDYRPYGTELQLCQRYYEEITSSALNENIGSGGGYPVAGPAIDVQAGVFFRVVKRTTPIITTSAASTFSVHSPGIFRNTATTITITSGGASAALLTLRSGTGGGTATTTGSFTFLEGSGSGTAKVMFNAEL